jgi:hypothetical protein
MIHPRNISPPAPVFPVTGKAVLAGFMKPELGLEIFHLAEEMTLPAALLVHPSPGYMASLTGSERRVGTAEPARLGRLLVTVEPGGGQADNQQESHAAEYLLFHGSHRSP